MDYRGKRPFDPRIYSRLEEVVVANDCRSLVLNAAARLLQLTTTAYEVYHALQYGTVGGLFPLHSEGLVAAGIYDHLRKLRRAEARVEKIPLAEGSFDVSKLTIAQIIEIRETDEFREYIRLLAQVKPSAKGKTFAETNKDYLTHLLGRYLPLINKRYPSTGWVAPVTKAVGTVGTTGPLFAWLETQGHLSWVSLSEWPLLVAVTALAGAIFARYSGEISKLVDWSHGHHRVKTFRRKNRYGLLGH